MSHHMPEHDPESRFEDEGIPDLQAGYPQQQWAVDPQEAPLPGDQPVAVDDYGTTALEQATDEPLSERLAREEPEDPGPGAEPQENAQPEEPSGRVWDEPRRAGRLVAPDEGVRPDSEPDEVAQEAGPDGGGYTAEEAAMRVEPE